jgi:hypothetical protein
LRHDEGTAAAAFTGSLRLNTIPTQAGSFAPLNGNPVFSAIFTNETPPFPQVPYTRATLSVNTPLNLCGYAPASGGFDLSLSGQIGGIAILPSLTFSGFRFAPFPDIPDIGFPPIKGTISTAGVVKVTHVNNVAIPGNNGIFYADDLNLRNFHAPGAEITFNQAGLNIYAGFNLNVTVGGFTRDLGDATFAGRIEPSGSFDLAGNGFLTLGNYSTDPFNMRFRSFNYAGFSIIPDNVTPNLNFDKLDVSVGSFGLHQNGLSYAITKSGDKSVSHLSGHVNTTFHYDIAWNYDFPTNTLNAGMTGNAWWKWEIQNFSPPPGFASSGTFNISGGISSAGTFRVDNNSASGNSFGAPFWFSGNNFAPPGNWFWGSMNTEDYGLW